MTTLYLVVPLALGVSTLFVVWFVWSVRHGQLDDLDTPPFRILEDDESDWVSARSQRPESRGREP